MKKYYGSVMALVLMVGLLAGFCTPATANDLFNFPNVGSTGAVHNLSYAKTVTANDPNSVMIRYTDNSQVTANDSGLVAFGHIQAQPNFAAFYQGGGSTTVLVNLNQVRRLLPSASNQTQVIWGDGTVSTYPDPGWATYFAVLGIAH